MKCTTFAPAMAISAIGARPCTALLHGYRWRAVAHVVSADFGFMPENSVTKRPARRLGKLTT